jgi:uncharacterized protein
MNKITFDTNILISSTLWKNSVSRKLLVKLIIQYAEIFITDDILDEYSNVLKRDFNLSKEEIKEKIEVVLSFCNIVDPSINIEEIKDDPTDNKVLECAVESHSEYIISYDKHLLNLKEFRNIKIVSPEEILELLRAYE